MKPRALTALVVSGVVVSSLYCSTGHVRPGSSTSGTGRATTCSDVRLPDTATLLAIDGRPAYVEQPTPLRSRKGVLLLGQPTWVWWSKDAFFEPRKPLTPPELSPPALGFYLRGGDSLVPVPLPPVAGETLQDLRVVHDGDAIHMVWASRPIGRGSRIARNLSYARFDGTQWTSPRVIADADAIFWSRTQSSMAWVRGQLVVAAPAYRNTPPDSGSGILVVRGRDGTWSREWMRRPGSHAAREALVQPLSDGRLLMTYNVSTEPALNGILPVVIGTRTSTDGGISWGDEVVVARIPEGNANWLQAARTDAGVLHLIWYLPPGARTGTASEIHHVSSRDGTRWTHHDTLTLQGDLYAYDVVPSATGLHLLVTRVGSPLTVLTWDGSDDPAARRRPYDVRSAERIGWRTTVTLPSPQVAVATRMTRVEPDSIYFSWTVPVRIPQGAFAPKMYLMRAPLCALSNTP